MCEAFRSFRYPNTRSGGTCRNWPVKACAKGFLRGAVSISPASGSFAVRSEEGLAGKALLGKAGAQLIRTAAASSSMRAPRISPWRKPFPESAWTVVTNAPAIAAAAMNLAALRGESCWAAGFRRELERRSA